MEAMIKMRAEEKGKGRKEVMDQLYKETMEQPKEKVKGRKEVIDQHYEDTTERPDKGEIGSKTLPVYTNTPRMLITGKIIRKNMCSLS